MSDENKARIEAINLSIKNLDQHLRSLKEVRQELRKEMLTQSPCEHEYIVLVTDEGHLLGSGTQLAEHYDFLCPICGYEKRITFHYGQLWVGLPKAIQVMKEEFDKAVRLFGR